MNNSSLKEDINKDNIGFYIWRLTKIWERTKQSVLTEFGLTSPQLEVLGAIEKMCESDQAVRQVDIAQALDTDPMTVSSILRNLERKEYVKRNKKDIDTRALFITITPDGSELLERAEAKAQMFQEKLFKDIDINEVILILKTFTERFEELLGEEK